MSSDDDGVREILRHLEKLNGRMDVQDVELAEIKAEAKKTNGRVTKLEGVAQTLLLWQAKLQGHAEALSWRFPAALAVLSGIAGAIAGHVLH